MKEKLLKVREALDNISTEASSYAGCRCDKDDCAPGDCWPCRMMDLSEKVSEPLNLIDTIIATLDGPELVDKVADAMFGEAMEVMASGLDSNGHRYDTRCVYKAQAEAAIDAIKN